MVRRLMVLAAALVTLSATGLLRPMSTLADVPGADVLQFAQVSNAGTADPCKEFVSPLDGLGGCTAAFTCAQFDCLGSSTAVITEPDGEQITLSLFATQPNPEGGWSDYQVVGSGFDDGAPVNVEGTMSFAALGCAGCPWLSGELVWYGA